MKYRALAAAVLLASPFAVAQEFDLTDMVPARPGQTVPAGDVVTEGNVVITNDESAALQVGHQQLIDDSEDGVRMLQVGSGTGILSIGSASYQTYDNINATLLSKRAAYNQAYLVAKKQFIENFEGVDQVCENLASTAVDLIDTGADSVGNTVSQMQENCKESVQGSLAGFVTYDVYDDVADKRVRISLISTPKTRSQIRDNAGAVAVTTQPNEIFKQVVADIRNGVLPPMGAKILTNAETGEVIVVGYGSAIIRQNTNAMIARQLKDTAKRQSQTRARSALIGTMQGEEIYWSGGFDERQMESSQQFTYDDPSLEDPTQAARLNEDRTTFVNQLRVSDDYGAISQGQLPPGVGTRSFTSDDGHWQYTVAVYSPTLEAVAREAAQQTGARSSQRNNGARLNVPAGYNSDAANPRGASGRVSSDADL